MSTETPPDSIGLEMVPEKEPDEKTAPKQSLLRKILIRTAFSSAAVLVTGIGAVGLEVYHVSRSPQVKAAIEAAKNANNGKAPEPEGRLWKATKDAVNIIGDRIKKTVGEEILGATPQANDHRAEARALVHQVLHGYSLETQEIAAETKARFDMARDALHEESNRLEKLEHALIDGTPPIAPQAAKPNILQRAAKKLGW